MYRWCWCSWVFCRIVCQKRWSASGSSAITKSSCTLSPLSRSVSPLSKFEGWTRLSDAYLTSRCRSYFLLLDWPCSVPNFSTCSSLSFPHPIYLRDVVDCDLMYPLQPSSTSLLCLSRTIVSSLALTRHLATPYQTALSKICRIIPYLEALCSVLVWQVY